MATYHGITKALCLTCGYATDDDTLLEMWNDYGDCLGPTHDFDEETSLWVLADGTVGRVHHDDDGNHKHDDLTGEDAANAVKQVDEALAARRANPKVV